MMFCVRLNMDRDEDTSIIDDSSVAYLFLHQFRGAQVSLWGRVHLVDLHTILTYTFEILHELSFNINF